MSLTVLTVEAILKLAFGKAVEKATEKLTEGTLQKLKQLQDLIWHKLRGQSKAEAALSQLQEGSENEVQTVVPYLQVAMNDDEAFAKQLQTLSQEIQQAIKIEVPDATGVQNIFDGGTGYQSNNNQGHNYQGQVTVNHNYGSKD